MSEVAEKLNLISRIRREAMMPYGGVAVRVFRAFADEDETDCAECLGLGLVEESKVAMECDSCNGTGQQKQ